MVEIYLDSADIDEMEKSSHRITGITTNPTLMRKAGVTDYLAFGMAVCSRFKDKAVSLEVCADDFYEMERQAKILSGFGQNAYVKIPITNTWGEPSGDLISVLCRAGIKVNVTAVLTMKQIESVIALRPAIISIFAGRIADTQIDPQKIVYAASYLKTPETKILWASAREVLNVKQAEDSRADIITLSPELIAKLALKEKDLTEFSMETVRMFYDDAKKAGYTL